eukprot:7173662-Pyramimonas_sp.AAC.1
MMPCSETFLGRWRTRPQANQIREPRPALSEGIRFTYFRCPEVTGICPKQPKTAAGSPKRGPRGAPRRPGCPGRPAEATGTSRTSQKAPGDL